MKMKITVIVDVNDPLSGTLSALSGPKLRVATEELVSMYVQDGLANDAAQVFGLPLVDLDTKTVEVTVT